METSTNASQEDRTENSDDWVMTQLALYETKIVDMPQIFLPFATEAKGQTLYEKVVEGKFLLGLRPEERKI